MCVCVCVHMYTVCVCTHVHDTRHTQSVDICTHTHTHKKDVKDRFFFVLHKPFINITRPKIHRLGGRVSRAMLLTMRFLCARCGTEFAVDAHFSL